MGCKKVRHILSQMLKDIASLISMYLLESINWPACDWHGTKHKSFFSGWLIIVIVFIVHMWRFYFSFIGLLKHITVKHIKNRLVDLINIWLYGNIWIMLWRKLNVGKIEPVHFVFTCILQYYVCLLFDHSFFLCHNEGVCWLHGIHFDTEWRCEKKEAHLWIQSFRGTA